MIPQETIQQILHAADVVGVVGDFVSLKKRGANMIACCPFHNEKTPSFSVSPSKQIYKCFGCGRGGDAVRFIMDLEGFSYPEALKWLAKKYGIEIVEKEYTNEELAAQNERDSLFIVTEFAQKYYAEQLQTGEGRSIGLAYFKERGFNENTVASFGLGYSPNTRDTFTQHAIKNGFKLEILEKAGLTIVHEGKEPIDRFRGRVIFPIHNVAGKPIAFGARILKADPKAPKYLNSPETDIYHKSRIVYGVFHAKTAIRAADNCFLVEGYTDVVSLYQAGIENVVASSGTSLTKEQIQLIRRFSPNITILYDGDAAGVNASLRGTDLILEEGMNVRVVVFPDGEDPDSFVKKVGSQGFVDYIGQNQKDFIRFKTELNLKGIANDPVAKAALIADLVQTIAKIPDAIKRAVFYQEVAALLQIDEAVLINEGNKILRKNFAAKKEQTAPQGDQRFGLPVEGSEIDQLLNQLQLPSSSNTRYEQKYNLEEELLRLVVNYCCFQHEEIEEERQKKRSNTNYLIERINEEPISIDNPTVEKGFKLFFGELEFREEVSIELFKTAADENLQKIVVNMLFPRYVLSPDWEKYEIIIPAEVAISEKLFDKALCRIYLSIYRIRGELEKDKLQLEISSEEEMHILHNIKLMKQKEMKIAEQLGAVL